MNNGSDSFIQKFFKQESAGGILLVVFALLALVAANSPLYALYRQLMEMPVAVDRESVV